MNSNRETLHKKPKIKAPEQTKIIDVPEQSRQVEDQDEEFFLGDQVGDFSFLHSLDPNELGKRIEKDRKSEKPKSTTKPIPEDEDEYSDNQELNDLLSDAFESNEEETYERKPRQGDAQWQEKPEPKRLALRMRSGKVAEGEEASSEEESGESSESESDSETLQEDSPPKPVEETKGPETLVEAKEVIAKLAEEIMETPDEKVSSLKTFREIFKTSNLKIKKLVLVAQSTVYRDIIPGYSLEFKSKLDTESVP
jgi:hypothetical protein